MSEIESFLHCAECVAGRPEDMSLQDYARIEVGFTEEGAVQLWCLRHDKEIVTLIAPGGVDRKEPWQG